MAEDTRAMVTASPQAQQVTMYEKIADPVAAAKYLGEQLFKSGLGGLKTLEQATVVAWSAMVNKKDPLEIVNENHIINGKLSRKADAMLAKFRQRGGKVKWTQVSGGEVGGTFTFDGDSLDFSFSIDDAKRAKYCYQPIFGTPNHYDGQNGRKEILKATWANDSMSMLKARCISRAIGFLDPESKGGYYTPEEVMDMSDTQVSAVQTESAFGGTPVQASAQVVESKPIEPEKPKTEEEFISIINERYGSEIGLFEEYLLGIKWLNEGEGLPSLPRDRMERIVNNRPNFDFAFNTFKVKKEKRKEGTNGADK